MRNKIRKNLIHLGNKMLKPAGARIVTTSIPEVHDPSTSYMMDDHLRELLADELTKTAETHFSRISSLSKRSMDYSAAVKAFMKIYTNRPLTENSGGSGFHNAFWIYLTARTIDPTLIVESGVFQGHTTWLLEQACPDAEIIGFDVNLNNLQHRNGTARFYEHDWSEHEFRDVDPERSMIFFDCHVNHARRMIESHERGFRHLVFDDDFPVYALYAEGLPGFPTAKMVWDGLEHIRSNEVAWSWKGKEIAYPFDADEAARAKSLLQLHEVYPDVGDVTGYGGFRYLSYAHLVAGA